MNRHLSFIGHGNKMDFDSKVMLYHKYGAKKNELNEPMITIVEVVEHWKTTHDKKSTLRKLGRVLRYIDESHENDLISK